MTPLDRQRAGAAVAARVDELNLTITGLAKRAGVAASTVRDLIRGRRWPRTQTLRSVEQALGWSVGTIARCARPNATVNALAAFTTDELLGEICRRRQVGGYLRQLRGDLPDES
jgi:predicted transcriptional regulator